MEVWSMFCLNFVLYVSYYKSGFILQACVCMHICKHMLAYSACWHTLFYFCHRLRPAHVAAYADSCHQSSNMLNFQGQCWPVLAFQQMCMDVCACMFILLCKVQFAPWNTSTDVMYRGAQAQKSTFHSKKYKSSLIHDVKSKADWTRHTDMEPTLGIGSNKNHKWWQTPLFYHTIIRETCFKASSSEAVSPTFSPLTCR